jgi:DNA-binding response OmpR family regulator
MTSTKNRILIADDEPELLSLMQDLLSSHFEVVVAKMGMKPKNTLMKKNF